LRLIAQEAFQSFLAAGLHARTIRHKIRAAGGAYRITLRLGRLLRCRWNER
jgi:hypothetical protein